MKITLKQLRKIIKEELENTLADSNSNNIEVQWDDNGKIDDDRNSISVTYPVVITSVINSREFKVKTWVTYNYDDLYEPTCSMTEDGQFNYIGDEELENNMSEEEFFATLQKLEAEALKQASKIDFVKDAKDTIEDHNLEQRDRNEMSKDPDAYYGVKGQFKPRR